MQIEDSHRDYYDYACPHLIDKTIVYHRNSQVVLGQELFFNPNPFHIDVEKWFNRFHHQWECQTWEFGLYVGYEYYKFLSADISKKDNSFWNIYQSRRRSVRKMSGNL